ncbi:uncharacterized protein AC631_01572 [Debaryomyces fabryi]|uniref:COP9 signalosome complex subunit 5 n=1 Tax=Debaryomyces fabryi TaxID=58627 RepID=A0A0V1Q2C7_9ASCO|nr:uncharacterized protein AC631_01572 [Debaryomyces fabryi]KSA02683.1 hypothetical protein AC631_01572 [Debaryomyces fabryi]
MSVHAKSGGTIEVMGMMTGKIIKNSIIVMDVYPLPVEGTETRVNAQAEGYEYMVQYLENLKQVGRNENIVGWYHSHPGYGCWLSGIDVATQSLNQNFQDPYLAIVIDPMKTEDQGKVEIGAFRAFPDNYKPPDSVPPTNTTRGVPPSKQKDFGVHSDKYYSLDIQIFKSRLDSEILDIISNKSWISKLVKSVNTANHQEQNMIENVFKLINKLQKKEINQLNRFEISFIKKFDLIFEEIISKKLMNDNRFYSTISQSSFSSFSRHGNDGESSSNDDMEDESDLDDRDKGSTALDISDTGNDDVMSMESSVNVYTDKRGDEDDDDDDDDEDEDDDNDNYDKRPMYTNYRSKTNLPKSRKLGPLQQEHVKLLNNVNKTIANISSHSKDIGLTELQDLIALKTKELIFLGK